MTSGDPKYHSGRKKKEYASPYLEFLAKITTNARRMPQYYEFDPQYADGCERRSKSAARGGVGRPVEKCSAQLCSGLVPEPSTCALALAALACSGYSLFRRRRAR